MIRVEKLTKYYGNKLGVEDISFTIAQGEIIGLLGPNGAGKSTIMKMLTGYIMPTSGSIFIDGIDAIAQPGAAAAKIGFMPELPPLYTEMTVEDYLRFAAGLRGVARAERERAVAEVMAAADIAHVAPRLIKNLSKGYRQRVGLAQALLAAPEILILDEPTVGLDPKQIAEVRALLARLSAQHTIILSSHILSEINMLCERLIVLDRGRIVAMDTTEHIEAGGRGDRFRLRVQGDAAQALDCIRSIPGVAAAELAPKDTARPARGGALLDVTGAGDEVRVAIFRALAEADMPILALTEAHYTLEQAFLRLTGTEDSAS